MASSLFGQRRCGLALGSVSLSARETVAIWLSTTSAAGRAFAGVTLSAGSSRSDGLPAVTMGPESETPPAGRRGGALERSDAPRSGDAPDRERTIRTPVPCRAAHSEEHDSVVGLDRVEFVGDGAPLIEAGIYEGVAGRARLVFVFGVHKLVVPFTVIVRDADEPDGCRHVIIARYYNVSRHGRRICVSTHGDYAREWALIAGRRIGRRDRPHVHAFEGAFCRVEVRTVTKDREQRRLPEHARYSRVARVLELLAGGVRQ